MTACMTIDPTRWVWRVLGTDSEGDWQIVSDTLMTTEAAWSAFRQAVREQSAARIVTYQLGHQDWLISTGSIWDLPHTHDVSPFGDLTRQWGVHHDGGLSVWNGYAYAYEFWVSVRRATNTARLERTQPGGEDTAEPVAVSEPQFIWQTLIWWTPHWTPASTQCTDASRALENYEFTRQTYQSATLKLVRWRSDHDVRARFNQLPDLRGTGGVQPWGVVAEPWAVLTTSGDEQTGTATVSQSVYHSYDEAYIAWWHIRGVNPSALMVSLGGPGIGAAMDRFAQQRLEGVKPRDRAGRRPQRGDL